jgi:hypothetical protein
LLKRTLTLLAALMVGALAFAGLASTSSATPDTVTICHAAGQADTIKFVTLTIPYNAAYGEAGHFNEDGTPQAGHENDYEGACEFEGCVPVDVDLAVIATQVTVECPPDTTIPPTTEPPTTEPPTTAPPTTEPPTTTTTQPEGDTSSSSTIPVADPTYNG